MFICVAQNYDIIILFEINKLYILDFFCNTVNCDRTCLLMWDTSTGKKIIHLLSPLGFWAYMCLS